MGLYDSVFVRCKCGQDVEFQSKGGDCVLANYTMDTAPNAVLGYLAGRSEFCHYCDERLTVIANSYVSFSSEKSSE